LTREGLLWFIIAAALLFMGMIKGINLVMLLASLLFMLVLWNWWEARRQLRGVAAERQHDQPPFAQTPFHWSIRVHNGGRRTVAGLDVKDGDAPQQSWLVTELAAGGTLLLDGEITYARRGYAAGHDLMLASGHPLGLVSIPRLAEPAVPRIVLPRLGRLHRAQLLRFLSRRSPSVGQSRALPCHAPTAHAEFHGLRPYRPGDSPRHLHWRTTARRGELMVREYEDWPNDDLTLVLEARKARGAGDDDATDPILEEAISLVATICWEWCRQTGDRLTLAVAGAQVTVGEGVTGHLLARTLLERLALEPGAAAVDIDELITRLHGCHLSPGPILVVSPTPSDLASRLQLVLRRRTAPVAVGSGDASAFFEF
jgi:uncharacterized protein (DUF58 family)